MLDAAMHPTDFLEKDLVLTEEVFINNCDNQAHWI